MTNTKTTEPRVVAGRQKAAVPPAAGTGEPVTDKPDTELSTESAHDRPNPLLDQLVALTRSIGDLVQQNTGSGDDRTTAPDTDAPERARAVFAYDFLGVVLGRRAPSVFQLTTVTVVRNAGTLTFTGLAGATAAKIRAADNTVQVLEGLREGVPVTIDQGPKAIPGNLRIDSIVTFTAIGGTPVAIGPCLEPAGGIIF
jgi:hypothetical protein